MIIAHIRTITYPTAVNLRQKWSWCVGGVDAWLIKTDPEGNVMEIIPQSGFVG